jgi:DNA-binding MarR family transcriptional regulator
MGRIRGRRPSAPPADPTGPHRRAKLPEVREALDALRHIVQTLRVGRAGEQRAGLGSAQLFALQQIGEHPGSSVNDIAALTFTHQSSVSVVIQRLVDRGLVARVPSSDDRRRHKLALTAPGRRLLDRAPVAVQEDLIAAIASLDPGDRRVVARSLNAIARQIAHGAVPARPPMFFEGEGERNARKRERS